MSWIGYAGLAVALYLLGQLSRKLGRVTQAPRYYLGLYFAALLLAISAMARLSADLLTLDVEVSFIWLLVYNGIPSLGLTLGVVFAWRYWSWLFAERD